MTRRLCSLSLVLAVLLAAGAVRAQTPAQDTGNAPVALELSDAQKHTIYQSVSKTQKNNAAPLGFRVAVGASIPSAIETAPVSDTLTTLVPELRPLRVTMIEKQVVLVERDSKRIVAVVVAEEP